MSRNSKSVSFEEYRHKPWRDLMLEQDIGGGGDYNGRGRECSNNDQKPSHPQEAYADHHHGTSLQNPNNVFHQKSSSLHPGLESKEDFWKNSELEETFSMTPYYSARPSSYQVDRNVYQTQTNELSSHYIMPSSFGGVLSSPTNSSPSFCLPPPTSYRDDFKGFSKGPSSAYEGSFDLIEIKSPRKESFQNRESDIGLVPTSSSLHPKLCKEETYEQGQHETSPCGEPQLPRMRPGIFNLPELYCPPPLPPLQPPTIQQVATPSQISRVMPSFVHNAFASPQQLHPQPSPRVAFSEPLIQPVKQPCYSQFEGSYSSPTVRSEAVRTTRFPIIITPRRVERLVEKQQPQQQPAGNAPVYRCGTAEPLRCAPKVKQFFGEAASKSRRSLQYEHQSDCHLLGNVLEVTGLPSGTEDYHVIHGGCGGGGDHPESSSPLPQVSKHNCLSPRAKVSSMIQPSVITPRVSESLLVECVTNLKSPHWEDNFEAFSQIYNLTEIHPTKVRNILNKIIWHGLSHLSSPRSKLARMACICFKRMFQTQKRSMEIEGEKVFYRLLDLCGGLANNFIQQESRDALVAAVENMDPLKSISFLELHGSKHKNPHVREFSAYLLTAIMDDLPQGKLMNKDFSPRILPMIVSFLREGLLQTRLHGKLALDKVFDHPTFESKLRRYVSPENVRHIAETLREFKERRSGNT